MKYKIKEYTFDDGRVWYKAFYKRFIFWHPITWCWAHMSWTAKMPKNLLMSIGENTRKLDITQQTR